MASETLPEVSYARDPDGIHRPDMPALHRDAEYSTDGFTTLLAMQERHFWYCGRHRFLHHAVKRWVPQSSGIRQAVDLGGGVGGWVRYIAAREPENFGRVALADSSDSALRMAAQVIPAASERYQVDLMRLGWNS